jgi:glycosyltransferase involved in cell wall biosynthesis
MGIKGPATKRSRLAKKALSVAGIWSLAIRVLLMAQERAKAIRSKDRQKTKRRPPMEEIEISIVIPVHNDYHALEKAIPFSIDQLQRLGLNFELIIAEDGSTDGSRELAERWARSDHRICLLHGDERMGRGKALARSFKTARGKVICYYDADLATPLKHLPDMINAILGSSDIATGSRILPGSDASRSIDREVASRAYNFLVRLILGSRIADHQCGFKAFKRETILPLLDEVNAEHWFWDTEVLVRGQLYGYKIREIPVQWRQGRHTAVRPEDAVRMSYSILHLWWQLNVSKK